MALLFPALRRPLLLPRAFPAPGRRLLLTHVTRRRVLALLLLFRPTDLLLLSDLLLLHALLLLTA